MLPALASRAPQARSARGGRAPLLVLGLAATAAGFLLGSLWSTANRPATPALAPPGENAPFVPAPAAGTAARLQAAAVPVVQAPARAGVVEPVAGEYLEQGRDRLADGDLAGGLEAFEAAVQFDPSAASNGALGALYFMMQAGSNAETYLRRAAELEPDNPDRWVALANAYHLRADLGGSWEAMRRARELEPGLMVERDPSGFLYRANSDPDSVFYQSPYIPRRKNQ